MDVLTLLRLIKRHWRVTVPVALLTLLGSVIVLQTAGPTYSATGSIVLLSPPAPPESDDGTPAITTPPNPYARFGDLSVMADVVAEVMAADSTRDLLLEKGVTDYEVVANRFDRGPVIGVTGESDDAEGAVESAQVVIDEIGNVLFTLQRGDGSGDPAYFITADVLTTPAEATALYGSTLRAAIAVLAIGSLLTLAAAVMAETLPSRWREWRAAQMAVRDARTPATADSADGLADRSAAESRSTSPDDVVAGHRLAYQSTAGAPNGDNGPSSGSSSATKPNGRGPSPGVSTSGRRPNTGPNGGAEVPLTSIGSGWSPATPTDGDGSSEVSPGGNGWSATSTGDRASAPTSSAGRGSPAKPRAGGGSSAKPRAGRGSSARPKATGRSSKLTSGGRSTAVPQDDDRPDIDGSP
jgi:hypothetical protein